MQYTWPMIDDSAQLWKEFLTELILRNFTTQNHLNLQVVPKGLPGYESYHSIQITYNFQVNILQRSKKCMYICTEIFQNGTQSPNHPTPGEPYYAIGFPKTAFLPDNEQVIFVSCY